MPVYDPYDPTILPPRADDEDDRVLDAAVPGRAHLLATCNFADFRTPSIAVPESGPLQILRAAGHSVLIPDANRTADTMML